MIYLLQSIVINDFQNNPIQSLKMSYVTLCIPRVFPNISESRIRNIFEQLNLGNVGNIDMVSTTNQRGEKFNRIFVHFNTWFRNEDASRALERLKEGNEIKIIYDEPWFWKVSLYRKKEQPQQQPRYQPMARPQARIEFTHAHAHAPAPAFPVAPTLPVAPALSVAPTLPVAPALSVAHALSVAPTLPVAHALPSKNTAFTTPPRQNQKPKTPARPKKQPRLPSTGTSQDKRERALPKPIRLADVEEGEVAENKNAEPTNTKI